MSHAPPPDVIRIPRVAHELSLAAAFGHRATRRDLVDDALSADEIAGVMIGALRSADGWAYPSAHDRRPLTVRALLAADTPPVRTAYTLDPAGQALQRDGHQIRESLTAVAHDEQPWLDVAPVVLAVEADIGSMAAEFASQDSSGLRGRDFVMLEAGTLVQNILLGAAATGVAAVLVGGLRQDECRALLDTSRHVCCLVAIGRPRAAD